MKGTDLIIKNKTSMYSTLIRPKVKDIDSDKLSDITY